MALQKALRNSCCQRSQCTTSAKFEDLLNVPAGNMYVQPPVNFAAIDSIPILGGTAYMVQITEDVERNITVGLLSVLACLPSHLEVRFVWAAAGSCVGKAHIQQKAHPADSQSELSITHRQGSQQKGCSELRKARPQQLRAQRMAPQQEQMCLEWADRPSRSL